ncbi:hypothetical protein AQ505_08140 [Pedobacter sp. PACM 27299]|uniref:KTSC domain-containing protein n=1 Tax=Pedobacter sp. PACM 27299 TaxID=1727164 RepID=UPI000706E8C5|nr:KTSC domain-containing protein [Pedobacter sp. PACM 27299]ALL05464.1 hypothetical protein AQ505_08140 [Pedobacter sp. PACM 27299]
MNLPEMTFINSSTIESVGYDEQNEDVYVTFLKGGLYVYRGVNQFEFENLRDAPSAGSYLHRNYKNVYPCERVG